MSDYQEFYNKLATIVVDIGLNIQENEKIRMIMPTYENPEFVEILKQKIISKNAEIVQIMTYDIGHCGSIMPANDSFRYCMFPFPNQEWANIVFEHEEESFAKLIQSIEKSVLVDYQVLDEEMHRRQNILNKLNLKQLICTSSETKTFLTLGLNQAIWTAGSCKDPKTGVDFWHNIPSFEVFSAPNMFEVDGMVKITKPTIIDGFQVDDLQFEFEKGMMEKYECPENSKQIMEHFFNANQNTKYLGEIAIVDKYSPINLEKVVYKNVLLDENACCHIAFGRAYDYSGHVKETLNKSNIHQDVMFGTDDMNITGITQDDEIITIMVNGEWELYE